jgi:hypothetical protein
MASWSVPRRRVAPSAALRPARSSTLPMDDSSCDGDISVVWRLRYLQIERGAAYATSCNRESVSDWERSTGNPSPREVARGGVWMGPVAGNGSLDFVPAEAGLGSSRPCGRLDRAEERKRWTGVAPVTYVGRRAQERSRRGWSSSRFGP